MLTFLCLLEILLTIFFQAVFATESLFCPDFSLKLDVLSSTSGTLSINKGLVTPRFCTTNTLRTMLFLFAREKFLLRRFRFLINKTVMRIAFYPCREVDESLF